MIRMRGSSRWAPFPPRSLKQMMGHLEEDNANHRDAGVDEWPAWALATSSGLSHNAERRPAKSSPVHWPGLFPVPVLSPKSHRARVASCRFRKFLVVVPSADKWAVTWVFSHFLLPYWSCSSMAILWIVTDGSHLQTFEGVLFWVQFPSIRISFLSSVFSPSHSPCASCQMVQLNLIMMVNISGNDR